MKSLVKNVINKTVKFALLSAIAIAPISSVFGQKAKTTSLLWKIEGNGLQKPSYLFGTNHMLCESDYHMPQKVKDAMNSTEQSYLEINLADPNLAKETQKHMTTAQPLSTLVSKEDAHYIDSLLQVKLKTSLKQLENIKPMLIVSSIMQTSLPCKLISFEGEIIKATKASNKEVKGLSSIEEQYSFLDKIFKPKDFVPYLKMWSDEELKRGFTELKGAYLKEDLDKIDELMAAFYTADPDGYRNLLPVRNHLWADRIPAIAKEKPTFFAVGCGHLQGKEGMIGILQAKGFKVTPVFN
ncbi:TraB/GumN family protein [Pedobacter chitinilyticus]|uniref:TraB/GumN family protein n=1 Tax=Pedobacter chitinilyticus TaxID=2233776 RepID=A0A3S3R832_9SPHI|nr:TraB/GumN family protein [Pedobacter chitinilyticus]RWU10109.1 TraB/GumN family protein [Pedobacter chitinilyticus]